ncbi:DUF4433 domain-containing protein [Thauera humireducens]|uniref:DUF4433 domain-containing protein n=1 Tax=Thauera humireducens TaxID=1134435 RepID=UPI0009EE35F1|nr:DUF4433 domain-containing protein [Thauera humireducens]
MEWIVGLFVIWLISMMSGASSRAGERRELKNEGRVKKEKVEDSAETAYRKNQEAIQRAIQRAKRLKQLEENEFFLDSPASGDKKNEEAKPTEISQTTLVSSSNVESCSDVQSVGGEKRTKSESQQGVSCGIEDSGSVKYSQGGEQQPTLNVEERTTVASHLKVFGVHSLWHITHRDNIKSILDDGVVSNTQAFSEFKPIDISNQDVQKRRERIEPFYNRKVHDYAPLYINVRNPMLYVRKHLQNELCLLEISLSVLDSYDYLYTDGNAASRETRFYREVKDLIYMPWDVLRASYWNDFTDGKRKRCAEVLIFPFVAPDYIVRVHCASPETARMVRSYGCEAVVSRELFF